MIVILIFVMFILERQSRYTISKFWLLLLLPIIMIAEGLQ